MRDSYLVELPVTGEGFTVSDQVRHIEVLFQSQIIFPLQQGNIIPSEVLEIPAEIRRIPGRQSQATGILLFSAEMIPPLAAKIYKVEKGSSNIGQHRHTSENRFQMSYDNMDNAFIVNDGIREIKLEDEFLYYKATVGINDRPEHRASGAYIFRPNGDPIPIDVLDVVQNSYLFYDEFQVNYKEDWVSKRFRIYHDDQRIEVSWTVGPIPVDDLIGKEVITKMCHRDIRSNGTFFTDSNGRQIMERRRDERPSYEIDPDIESVSQDYYPVTAMIGLGDEEQEMVVLTDRAQGGSSLEDGCIELMLHRQKKNEFQQSYKYELVLQEIVT